MSGVVSIAPSSNIWLYRLYLIYYRPPLLGSRYCGCQVVLRFATARGCSVLLLLLTTFDGFWACSGRFHGSALLGLGAVVQQFVRALTAFQVHGFLHSTPCLVNVFPLSVRQYGFRA